jgi:hypothetical protein
VVVFSVSNDRVSDFLIVECDRFCRDLVGDFDKDGTLDFIRIKKMYQNPKQYEISIVNLAEREIKETATGLVLSLEGVNPPAGASGK